MDGVSSIPLELMDRDQIKLFTNRIDPDIVIYAAGNNSLRWNEENDKIAEKVHGSGVVSVLEATALQRIQAVYLSNSYVFDGHKGNYKETDLTLPSTVLGKAKTGGEGAIKSKTRNWAIVRSSPLLGRGTGRHLTFFDQMRMSLERGKPFEAPANELHAFATIYGLVDMIERIIDTEEYGRVFHYGGKTRINHFEMAQAFARRFKYDPNLVQVAKPGTPPKPFEIDEVDYSLNSSDSARTLKLQPLLLEESFDLIEKNLIANLRSL